MTTSILFGKCMIPPQHCLENPWSPWNSDTLVINEHPLQDIVPHLCMCLSFILNGSNNAYMCECRWVLQIDNLITWSPSHIELLSVFCQMWCSVATHAIDHIGTFDTLLDDIHWPYWVCHWSGNSQSDILRWSFPLVRKQLATCIVFTSAYRQKPYSYVWF